MSNKPLLGSMLPLTIVACITGNLGALLATWKAPNKLAQARAIWISIGVVILISALPFVDERHPQAQRDIGEAIGYPIGVLSFPSGMFGYIAVNSVYDSDLIQFMGEPYHPMLHLASPSDGALVSARLMTDAGQTIAWGWNRDAFGLTNPEENPDGAAPLERLDPRFPGQIYDGVGALLQLLPGL